MKGYRLERVLSNNRDCTQPRILESFHCSMCKMDYPLAQKQVLTVAEACDPKYDIVVCIACLMDLHAEMARNNR